MQLQIGVDNYFGWVSPDPTPSIEDVSCVVAGVACSVVQSSDRPEVFIFGPIKPTVAALDVPYTISVDGDTADFGLLSYVTVISSQVVALSSSLVRIAADPGQDITFTLLDKAGDEVLDDEVVLTESDTNPGSYAGYVTSPEAAGFYIGVVLADNIPIKAQVFVVGVGGNQTCLFVAARVDGGNSTAIDEAEILISYNDEECAPVVRLVTDMLGAASTSLAPGSYVATLRKGSAIFSQNNFEFLVESISSLYRTVHLTTKWYTPTFASATIGSIVVLSGYLRRADGQPITDALVVAEPLTSLFSADSATAYSKTAIVAKTSATGYFELRLVPGIEARIGIPALGVTRRIITPDEDADLLSMLASAPDAFSVVNLRPARKVAR